jgi:hypothetical protein
MKCAALAYGHKTVDFLSLNASLSSSVTSEHPNPSWIIGGSPERKKC